MEGENKTSLSGMGRLGQSIRETLISSEEDPDFRVRDWMSANF